MIDCQVRMRSSSVDGIYYILTGFKGDNVVLNNTVIIGHTEDASNFRAKLAENVKSFNKYRQDNGFDPIRVTNFNL